MIALVVFVLCAVTAAACAVLLFRGYLRSGVRLLFWAGLCFVGLALNNVMVFVDVVIFPEIDLWVLRQVPALLGVIALVYGLVWESSS